MPQKSLPTMKDVAQEAGVALGTVSKVFNGIPVGDSYRLRVEAAAKKLGYQVNQYARGLRASKTYTVAVILPGVVHPFFAALAQHLCTALTQRDHRMLLYVTASRPDIEQRCVTMVQQNRVDGIIGLTYNSLTVDKDLPFVGIDRSFRADIPRNGAASFGDIKFGCSFRSRSAVSLSKTPLLSPCAKRTVFILKFIFLYLRFRCSSGFATNVSISAGTLM